MTQFAFTVDLEDWHQLVRRQITGEVREATPAVVTATHRLLDVLDDARVRATFFVLGLVAMRYPELIREIASRGHEIGSHTLDHQLISHQSPNHFKADVVRSRQQLQDLTGQPVLGFRAPEFSVSALDHWCFRVLAEAGFEYDSSVFPWARARYGIPNAPCHPFLINTDAGRIQEFPLAVWSRDRFQIPVAGGTYYRLLPGRLLLRSLRAVAEMSGTAVVYAHPYAFYSGWLYLSDLGWQDLLHPKHLRHCVLHNFATAQKVQRLQLLLHTFSFVPLGEIYASMTAHPPELHGGERQL